MTTNPETTQARLSPEGSDAVRRAFAAMPYAADPRVMKGPITMGSYREGLTEDALVEALLNLADVLRLHAQSVQEAEVRHTRLAADVAAMRRVLGTDSI